MNATAIPALERVPRPRRQTLVWGLVLVNVQALFVLSYASVFERPLLDPFLWYPFVWINVGLWAIVRTRPPSAPRRTRIVAAAVAVAYFLLLAAASNTIWLGEAFGGNPAIGLDLRIATIPPGWAPAVLYNGQFVHFSLIPPYVIGFSALSYLVYATVLDARGVASVGLLAAFSCVSCTLPIVAGVVALGTGASAGALLTSASSYLLPVGTALYVGTVALLYFRPGVPGTAGANG